MDMCVRGIKIVVFISIAALFCAFFGSCGPMDSFFTSGGNYKINIKINNLPLDECSFARSGDRIQPYFEESVINDPDITSLVVFLRDSMGEIAGWKVIYEIDQSQNLQEHDPDEDQGLDEEQETLSVVNDKNNDETENNEDNEELVSNAVETDNFSSLNNEYYFEIPSQYKNGDELVIPVKSLDNLPFLPIPPDLSAGRYTIVSQIMSDKNILQRIEKTFFYLSSSHFSYNGISIHLPGIAESNQLIPKGTIIMLEANIDFDSGLDPFIEWYHGKKVISEGLISEGAGNLFWKAPEESGFFSLRAIVFPVEEFHGLAGFQKEISLLVSSKSIDIHLITEDSPELQHWYTLEANLNDLKTPTAEQTSERALKHVRNSPKWKASNGTYGIVTGNDNIITLPKVSVSEKDNISWQLLFRFKPENDGGILTVQFGKVNDAFLHLYMKGSNLVLTLTSSSGSVSQIYNLNRAASNTISVNTMTNNSSSNDVESVVILSPSESDESDLLWTDLEDEEFDFIYEEITETVSSQAVLPWIREESFIVLGIIFTIYPELLSAQVNILGDHINSELKGNPISLEAEIKNEFQVSLGFLRENRVSMEESSDESTVRHEFTALWDEAALYRKPRIAAPIKQNQQSNEEQDVTPEVVIPIENSPQS